MTFNKDTATWILAIFALFLGGFMVGFDVSKRVSEPQECTIPDDYCDKHSTRALQGCEFVANNIHLQLKMREFDLKMCEENVSKLSFDLEVCKNECL